MIMFRTFKDLWRIRSDDKPKPKEESGGQNEPISKNEKLLPTDFRQLQYYSLAIMGSLVGYLLPAAFISFTYFSHVWVLIALAVALNEVAKATTQKVKVSSSLVESRARVASKSLPSLSQS
jgi:uncharacterized membrane protein